MPTLNIHSYVRTLLWGEMSISKVWKSICGGWWDHPHLHFGHMTPLLWVTQITKGQILLSLFSFLLLVFSTIQVSLTGSTSLHSWTPSLPKHSLWNLLSYSNLFFFLKNSKGIPGDHSQNKHFPFSIKMAQKTASPCMVSAYMDADWHLWMESMNRFLAVHGRRSMVSVI